MTISDRIVRFFISLSLLLACFNGYYLVDILPRLCFCYSASVAGQPHPNNVYLEKTRNAKKLPTFGQFKCVYYNYFWASPSAGAEVTITARLPRGPRCGRSWPGSLQERLRSRHGLIKGTVSRDTLWLEFLRTRSAPPKPANHSNHLLNNWFPTVWGILVYMYLYKFWSKVWTNPRGI